MQLVQKTEDEHDPKKQMLHKSQHHIICYCCFDYNLICSSATCPKCFQLRKSYAIVPLSIMNRLDATSCKEKNSQQAAKKKTLMHRTSNHELLLTTNHFKSCCLVADNSSAGDEEGEQDAAKSVHGLQCCSHRRAPPAVLSSAQALQHRGHRFLLQRRAYRRTGTPAPNDSYCSVEHRRVRGRHGRSCRRRGGAPGAGSSPQCGGGGHCGGGCSGGRTTGRKEDNQHSSAGGRRQLGTRGCRERRRREVRGEIEK
jgi:hypothetical protein